MDLLIDPPPTGERPGRASRHRPGRVLRTGAQHAQRSQPTSRSREPLPLRSPLTVFGAALRHGPVRWLDQAVRQGIDPNARPLRRPRQDPPLLRAVKSPAIGPRPHQRTVRLLDLGADARSTDALGTPPLWWATYRRRWDSALVLLERGASIMADSNTPEHPWLLAVERGRVEVVRAMLDRGWDVNATPYRGITGLFRLAYPPPGDDEHFQVPDTATKLRTLDLLHQHGVRLDAEDPERSPIARVVRTDPDHFEAEVFEWFVHHGVDLTVRVPHPLHRYRASPGGASPRGLNTVHYEETSWTLLHLAARANNGPLCCRLLDLGADPDALTSGHRTPLDVARGQGSVQAAIAIEQAMIRDLLEAAQLPSSAQAPQTVSGARRPRGRARL